MKTARFFKSNDNGAVDCFLCRHFCHIEEGKTGRCRVRKNIGGKLVATTYGRAIGVAVDPIEKKPFYNFCPGSNVLSFATVGCNFRCKFCQNYDISQTSNVEGIPETPPATLVSLAKRQGADGIAYTYTEPTVFMEYALDTAAMAKQQGLFNVFVTNGYESDAAINEMAKYIDAARVDLKFFDETIYEDLCEASFENVKKTITLLHKKMHIEIITLIIPGINDSDEMIYAECEWIKKLSPSIPIHFTGFYPSYKMLDTPPTPISTLIKAYEIATSVGLKYVYTGNRQDMETETTYCPNCGKKLITRQGFGVLNMDLQPVEEKYKERFCYTACPRCGEKLNVIIRDHGVE